MAKSPAFQFYPGDFLSHPKTLIMSAEEVGAYWLLICACWRDDGLPSELKTLAKLARVQQKKFTRLWQASISACFYLDDETQKYRNERMDEEIEKQRVNSLKKKAAADERWKHEQCKSNAPALQMECSSSSSSNKNKKEEKTNANAGLGDSRPVAVETVRKVGGLYPPKAVWNTIATRLGERPDEDRLRQCFESWVLRGNKPTNYAWATDWYVDGVPDYAKQQKKPPPPPADINSEDYVNKAPRLHFSVMAGVQFSNMEPSEVREIYPKFKSQYLADFPEAESEAVEYERSVEYQQIANGI